MLKETIRDPLPKDGKTVTGASSVFSKWYAAHSTVRRLWAIRESQLMRVIVMLEPTHDGDDIYPAWLSKAAGWAHELQLCIEGPVQLEVMEVPLPEAFMAGVDGALVAELFWRDSTQSPDYPLAV